MTDNICWLEMLEYKMRARVKPLIIFGILSVYIDNVNGDVFELKLNMKGRILPVSFLNTEQFAAFLRCNTTKLPAGAVDPFVDEQIFWEMLGYAVFFPEHNSTPQTVYVAKKRRALRHDNVANNNPNVGGHILHYSSNMHTERQLAIVVLEREHQKMYGRDLNIVENVTTVPTQFGPLLRGSEMPFFQTSRGYPQILTNNVNKDIKGTLCIYTEYSPCKVGKDESGKLGCVEYYQQIASMFINVKFDIYFKNTSNFFDNKYVWPAEVLISLANAYNKKFEANNLSTVSGFTKGVVGSPSNDNFSRENLETIKRSTTQKMFNTLYNTKRLKNLNFHLIN